MSQAPPPLSSGAVLKPNLIPALILYRLVQVSDVKKDSEDGELHNRPCCLCINRASKALTLL